MCACRFEKGKEGEIKLLNSGLGSSGVDVHVWLFAHFSVLWGAYHRPHLDLQQEVLLYVGVIVSH